MKKSTKPRIAIACQGGGSQTAFTAGVLKSLFEHGIEQTHEIVALTGTSGGALNAALAWNGMLRNAQGESIPVHKRIDDFWRELKADSPMEQFLDHLNTNFIRGVGAGHLPKFESSPSSHVSQFVQQAASYLVPRTNYLDFQGLIESHIRFDDIPSLLKPNSPTLMMGAANVQSGKLKIFNSRQDAISVETVLASAAIPSVFPAVQIGDEFYWDGLFSSNPPISPVIRPVYMGKDRFPDEIWIVLIDPLRYQKVPTAPAEILERRTQMTSNISLIQDLEKVALLSVIIEADGFKEGYLEGLGYANAKHLKFRLIKISEQVQPHLDYASKLSRDPKLIDMLMDDGARQVESLLSSLSEPGLTPAQAVSRIAE